MQPTFIFAIDETAPLEDLRDCLAGFAALIEQLPPSAPVGVVSFGAVVSVYSVADQNISEATVISGLEPPSESVLSALTRSSVIAPLAVSRARVAQIFEALGGSAPASTKPGVSSAPQPLRKGGRRKPQKRAFGVAMEVALFLISQAQVGDKPKAGVNPIGGRVVSALSGPASVGPGGMPDSDLDRDFFAESSVSFFRQLSDHASTHNIVIDCFCAGLATFRVSLLHQLVHRCGGNIVLHQEFSRQFLENVKTGCRRSCGRDATMSIRLSAPVRIAQMIGRVGVAADGSKNLLVDQSDGLPSTNRLYNVRLGDAQPSQALAIFLEHDEDFLDDFVYIQVAVTHTTFQNTRVLRVITHELRASSRRADFVQSLDANVIAVLMAKQIVLDASERSFSVALGVDTPDVQTDADPFVDKLDESLVAIIQKQPSGPKEIWLSTLIEHVYHLRRSPLLAPLLQHADDVAALRLLFLSTNLEDSLRIFRPTLLSISLTGESLDAVPLETLSLSASRVLVMDQHTDLFVWSGAATYPSGDAMRQACLEFAEETAHQRFPFPQILSFKQNSSLARWFVCRLGPSHRDGLQQQLGNHPHLAALSREQLAALFASLPHTDEITLLQYSASLTA
eukprot:TRINITY_DN9898_c0_g2_i1.p1 TRINITY_DN9898_c0_g2~~TRINITY_DN9898_c0_g2_i1.p1  ORF type:complete len:705 (-),score=150.16 TRINITY_DN9898_c0_g2_i1:18-1883(-)